VGALSYDIANWFQGWWDGEPREQARREVLGQFSLVCRTLWDLRPFAPRAATKIVEMTSAGSSPLSPAFGKDKGGKDGSLIEVTLTEWLAFEKGLLWWVCAVCGLILDWRPSLDIGSSSGWSHCAKKPNWLFPSWHGWLVFILAILPSGNDLQARRRSKISKGGHLL
jgi:hypothetical protein